MGSRLPIEITEPTPEAMASLWEAICEDAALSDLPYKVETNERGQLLMSPASTPHSAWQAELAYRLRVAVDAAARSGVVLTECAVLTRFGIKVPDVAWMTDSAWDTRSNEKLLLEAPALCIEVRSPSNSDAEMTEKRAIYIESGAAEVWIVDSSGGVAFFSAAGALPTSTLFPAFPARLQLR